jgi:hypothetical protein
MFPKFISALILATVVAWALPTVGRAQSMSDEALKLHLVESYNKSIAPGRLVKWQGPVRYKIFGPVPDIVKNYVREQIAELSTQAGIDIKETGVDPSDPPDIRAANNLVFIFDYKIDPYLTDKKVIAIFEKDGETAEQTKARIEGDFANSLQFAGWLIDKETIRRNIQILNISKLSRGNNIQIPILRMVFNALTSMTTSDGVQPSIMNSKPEAKMETVDIAILKSLYANPRAFPHMSPVATILDAYVADIRKRQG